MKKFLRKIFGLTKTEMALPSDIEGKIITTLNTIIQSPQIQGLEFKVSTECDKTSVDRKSTRLNSSHVSESRMPSSA